MMIDRLVRYSDDFKTVYCIIGNYPDAKSLWRVK